MSTTVLVVDDSAVDRKIAEGILKAETDWTIEYVENGALAIAKLAEGPIDVIVTDMQMPEMDGLELVRAVRLHYPNVPVVLMTGQGSEGLAVAALAEGAVGYIPKSKIASLLPSAVAQIAGLIAADRSYASLISCMCRNEFAFNLYNDPTLIDPLVDLIQQMIEGMEICDSIERVRVGVALEHALLNALYRGNLEITTDQMEQNREEMLLGGEDLVLKRTREEPYASREVFVEVVITRDQLEVVVRDQGPGFDVKSASSIDDSLTITNEGGRGLVLMNMFMDDVSFNDTGNEVTLIKKREPCKTSDSE